MDGTDDEITYDLILTLKIGMGQLIALFSIDLIYHATGDVSISSGRLSCYVACFNMLFGRLCYV